MLPVLFVTQLLIFLINFLLLNAECQIVNIAPNARPSRVWLTTYARSSFVKLLDIQILLWEVWKEEGKNKIKKNYFGDLVVRRNDLATPLLTIVYNSYLIARLLLSFLQIHLSRTFFQNFKDVQNPWIFFTLDKISQRRLYSRILSKSSDFSFG